MTNLINVKRLLHNLNMDKIAAITHDVLDICEGKDIPQHYRMINPYNITINDEMCFRSMGKKNLKEHCNSMIMPTDTLLIIFGCTDTIEYRKYISYNSVREKDFVYSILSVPNTEKCTMCDAMNIINILLADMLGFQIYDYINEHLDHLNMTPNIISDDYIAYLVFLIKTLDRVYDLKYNDYDKFFDEFQTSFDMILRLFCIPKRCQKLIKLFDMVPIYYWSIKYNAEPDEYDQIVLNIADNLSMGNYGY